MIEGQKVVAIIAAAGMSNRMGSPINKTFLHVDGKPVLAHTIEKFERCAYVDEIVLLARESEVEFVREHIVRAISAKKVVAITAGGATRQQSIANGLKYVAKDASIIMTHDGARPFIHVETIESALKAVLQKRACIVGVPVKDTIKSVKEEGDTVVQWTPKRSLLWSAQSPQVFQKEDLFAAYEYSERESIEATDDASLVEKIGIPVSMVMGTYDNIKITTPEDLILAELFVRQKGDTSRH